MECTGATAAVCAHATGSYAFGAVASGRERTMGNISPQVLQFDTRGMTPCHSFHLCDRQFNTRSFNFLPTHNFNSIY